MEREKMKYEKQNPTPENENKPMTKDENQFTKLKITF